MRNYPDNSIRSCFHHHRTRWLELCQGTAQVGKEWTTVNGEFGDFNPPACPSFGRASGCGCNLPIFKH